jgi:glycosyltransferase involved in cell wall biosynthesis/CheY-like chemotaxis protein
MNESFFLPEPSGRPLRVCFVSHSGADGGAQRSLIDLIDALEGHGVESRVVLPESGVVASALEARDVPYVIYRYWPWSGTSRLPRWDRFLKKPLVHGLRAVTLSRLIARWQCDVVVTNTCTVCEAALAARLLRLPHVTYVREFGDLDHGYHFELGARLSVRLLRLLSTRVVFNSAALAGHYAREVPPARARVIYNAVSIPAAFERPPEASGARGPDAPLSCVLVGYLNPGKGHEDAIRAIAHLRDRGVPARLRLVGGAGSATYVRRLRDRIRSLDVGDRVEMVGPVLDPWRFYQEADVALMCSRNEAFGRVTVEAMKLGVPVVGTRSGGTSEIIHDRFNGFLYTPGDARELADRLQALAQDRDGARRMGERARRFAAEMFNLERYGREFLDLLNEVVEPRPDELPERPERTARAMIAEARRAVRAALGRWLPRRHTQILVVDDDPLITRWLADSFGAEGHAVDVAGSGRTALAQLERGSYDLIVSDLRMPDVDGVALCRWLERERRREAGRMLFLTGNVEAPEYRDFLAGKRDRTVSKPVDLDALNRIARQILSVPSP